MNFLGSFLCLDTNNPSIYSEWLSTSFSSQFTKDDIIWLYIILYITSVFFYSLTKVFLTFYYLAMDNLGFYDNFTELFSSFSTPWSIYFRMLSSYLIIYCIMGSSSMSLSLKSMTDFSLSIL